MNRYVLALGGLFGFMGVAAAAYSAHGSADARLSSAAALIFLTHAAAFIALSVLAAQGRLVLVSIALLTVGVALFCGDMVVRVFFGSGLFNGAAPAGGLSLMAGWLMLTVSAFAASRRN